MTFRVLWSPRAQKDLARLDPPTQERIIAAVLRYAAAERGDVRRLSNVEPAEWRLRTGDWRVRFRLETAALQVLRVLRRDKAYR